MAQYLKRVITLLDNIHLVMHNLHKICLQNERQCYSYYDLLHSEVCVALQSWFCWDLELKRFN